MPTPTQAGTLNKHSLANNATTTKQLTGVVAGAALALWIGTQRFAELYTGELLTVTCGTATFVRVGHHVGVSNNAGGGFRQELSLYLATNVAVGTHTVTIQAASIGGNTELTQGAWVLTEYPGLSIAAPAAALAAAAVTARIADNIGSITVGPTAALSQAQSMILSGFAAQTNFAWNGTDPGTAPTGYTLLAAIADNTVPSTAIFAWQDVNSTAAVSATMGVFGAVGNPDGTRGVLVAISLAGGTNYVEILVTPDTEDGVIVNATTGWIVHIVIGDSKDGYVVFSGIASQTTGNEIRVSGAAPGVAVAGTVNVQVVNAGVGYTSGWGVGTVRAAA